VNECKPAPAVLVSPVTLKTVTLIFSATLGLEVNHSASAQDQGLALVHSSAQPKPLGQTSPCPPV